MSMAWGQKVSPEFKAKVIEISGSLGCKADHLMSAMAFETGESFDPSIMNPTGAVGLIQFLPQTATQLGTSTAELMQMSAERQLYYVKTYLLPFRHRMKNLGDLYMAILWPRGIGEPDSFVLFSDPSKPYHDNKGLDADRDGRITRAEATSKVAEKLQKGLRPEYAG